MRAVVVYESMYGNTHAVAEAIGRGLAQSMDVEVMRVADAHDLAGVDLLVLGAPTHAWGLSRPTTRRGAVQAADEPDSGLAVEPGAAGPGMREWLDSLPPIPVRIAIFDTRMPAPLGLSGSAAKGIARRARHRGYKLVDQPQGFIVSKTNQLVDGELDRARIWGERLAVAFAESAPS